MKDVVQIFVALRGEGVDVWRPVKARSLPGGVYLIVDQPYDRETESWEFEPGARVLCQLVNADDGEILAATKLVET